MTPAQLTWSIAMLAGVPVVEVPEVKFARENYPFCVTYEQHLSVLHAKLLAEKEAARVVAAAVVVEVAPVVVDLVEEEEEGFSGVVDFVESVGEEEGLSVSPGVSSPEEDGVGLARPIRFGSMWFDLGSRAGGCAPVSLRQPVDPQEVVSQQRLASVANALVESVASGGVPQYHYGHYVCQCGGQEHGVFPWHPGTVCGCACITVGGVTIGGESKCWCRVGHVTQWHPGATVEIGLTYDGEQTLGVFEYVGTSFQELKYRPYVFRLSPHLRDSVVQYWVKHRPLGLDRESLADQRFGLFLWALAALPVSEVVVYLSGETVGRLPGEGELYSLENVIGYYHGEIVFVVNSANASYITDKVLEFLFGVLDESVCFFSVCQSLVP